MQDDYKNDPNYECRVKTVTYIQTLRNIKGNEIGKMERSKTKVLYNPLPPVHVIKALCSSPIPGFTIGRLNVNNDHNRIGRHIVNHNPLRNKRGIQLRPRLQRVLNSRAVAMIKEGQSKNILDGRGKVLPEYKKTIVHRI